LLGLGGGFEFFQVALEVDFPAAIGEVGAFGVDAGEALADEDLGEFFIRVFKEDEGVVAAAVEDGLPAGGDAEGAGGEEFIHQVLGLEADEHGLLSAQAAEVAGLVVDAFAIVLVEPFFGGIDKVKSQLVGLAVVRDFEAIAVVVAIIEQAGTGEDLESVGGSAGGGFGRGFCGGSGWSRGLSGGALGFVCFWTRGGGRAFPFWLGLLPELDADSEDEQGDPEEVFESFAPHDEWEQCMGGGRVSSFQFQFQFQDARLKTQDEERRTFTFHPLSRTLYMR
jgi:hypothetical protein